MPDDPFTAQIRAAQGMQAMKQVAGYPYMPYSSQATGYEPQTGGRQAADMIGGVFNAWIGKKANDYQNEVKEAESVFTLAKLGYDLGDLLSDSKKRKAVEKVLGISLPQTAEGDYGPQSVERIQQNLRKAILKDPQNQSTLARVVPQAQAEMASQGQPPMQPPVDQGMYAEGGMPGPGAPGPGMPGPGGAAPGQPPMMAPPGESAMPPGMDPRMARILAADPQHQGRMEEIGATGAAQLATAGLKGQYDLAQESMKQRLAFQKSVGDNAQQLFRDYGGALPASSALDMSLSLMTGRQPDKGTVESFQNAMSPDQRELQKSILPVIKEAFPNLLPDQMSIMAGMAAQGKQIPLADLPTEIITWTDPKDGVTRTEQVPLNYLAKKAAINLEFQKVNTQYANLQKGQLQQLLTTPSKVMVPDNKGNMVPLPMALARDAQMIEESMERIRTSKIDIKNIDALVTFLRSTQVSPGDRSVALETLAKQLGFKTAKDEGFINWIRNYNQWRLLPPEPGEQSPFGTPPAGVQPGGVPQQPRQR
jgi:hypothetical protein